MAKSKRAKQVQKQKAATSRAKRSKKRVTKARPVKVMTASLPPQTLKPDAFGNFADMVNHARGHVYQINRLRQEGQQVLCKSLGTGFLVAPHRLMTCAHCLDNTEQPNDPMAHHVDGDAYILVQRDEQGQYHTATIRPVLNTDVYYYHETDFGIFHLPDDFYKMSGEYIKNPKDHLRLCDQPRNIGASAGILGYPLQGLVIRPNNLDISNIYLRGDIGVLNTRHNTDGKFIYEFTMPFNPGNSGGPIFDTVTGDVIGMVHAYNSIPINAKEETITKQNEDGTTTSEKLTSVIRTTYSIGLASENFKQYIAKHSLAFDN